MVRVLFSLCFHLPSALHKDSVEMARESIIIEEADDSNVVIDCDVLEASKENIQPLASGRRVTALARCLQPHTASATHDSQRRAPGSERRSMQALVADHEVDAEEDEEEGQGRDDDEVLLSYVQLVNWTVEHYPQGHSAESGILELLEEATRCPQREERIVRTIRGTAIVGHVRAVRPISRRSSMSICWRMTLGRRGPALYEEYAMILERGYEGRFVLFAMSCPLLFMSSSGGLAQTRYSFWE